MSSRSVMCVGGPYDGHRMVVQDGLNNKLQVPMAAPVSVWAGYYEDHDIPVKTGEYHIMSVSSGASKTPFWVGVWAGVR